MRHPFFFAAASWLGLFLATASAHAQTPPPDIPGGAATEGAKAAEMTASAPADLRGGHVLVQLGGGVAWIPSALVPLGTPVADLAVGGSGHLQLGVGLNRFLVLSLDGTVAHAALGGAVCDGCTLTTVGVGLGLEFHPSQAFAFDPWVRYALGYRFTAASADAFSNSTPNLPTNLTESALDFAKLSLGGDFYPDPAFGFGPFLELDVGVNRLSDTPQVYGNVQLGLRIAFDPMRAGTVITAGSAETHPATASH